ncbi:MAG: hypothetical protein ABIW31_05240, partial [Novosphingobium sp.]
MHLKFALSAAAATLACTSAIATAENSTPGTAPLSAQPPAPTKPLFDSDGTVHVPAFDMPPSP